MTNDSPTIGDVIREEIRICREFEKANPEWTLDTNGQQVPKREPSNASRCDTCTLDGANCCHRTIMRPGSRMICCPHYEGSETFAAFLVRERSSIDRTP
jgi:hypothetical protein